MCKYVQVFTSQIAPTSPVTMPKFDSKCRSPLQITILKLNYTTCRIVQPRSSHKDVDDYLISNTGGFVCMQEN